MPREDLLQQPRSSSLRPPRRRSRWWGARPWSCTKAPSPTGSRNQLPEGRGGQCLSTAGYGHFRPHRACEPADCRCRQLDTDAQHSIKLVIPTRSPLPPRLPPLVVWLVRMASTRSATHSTAPRSTLRIGLPRKPRMPTTSSTTVAMMTAHATGST